MKRQHYSMPTSKPQPLTDEIVDYFGLRKISRETLEKCGRSLAADEQGNILFCVYDKHDRLVYVKHRPPRRTNPGEAKETADTGTENHLWNIENVSFSKPLIITEGMIDALSVMEAGFDNVVALSGGCQNLGFFESSDWDTLEKCKSFVIWTDGDDPGIECREELIKRLGYDRCNYVVDFPVRPNSTAICKDANELLYFFGPDRVAEAIANSEEPEIKGVIPLSDVVPLDVTSIPRISTGVRGLDASLGGLAEGGISLIVGDAGSGKSTIAGPILLEALEQGRKVCAYSGELSAQRFQEWIYLQTAGEDYIGLAYDKLRQKNVPVISRQVQERLSDYFRDRFYLFDNEADFQTDIIDALVATFEVCARRYGCSVFLLDNLMSMTLGMETDENAAQAKLINAMKRFALRYKVHVIIVAHLRKRAVGRTNDAVTGQDVSGNSVSVKAADCVILVANQTLKILKSRDTGILSVIPFVFCPSSRRIYELGTSDSKVYSWNKDGVKKPDVRACDTEDYQEIQPPLNDDEPF